jgi:hypothetical protein
MLLCLAYKIQLCGFENILPPTDMLSYNYNGSTLYPVIMALPSTWLPQYQAEEDNAVGENVQLRGFEIKMKEQVMKTSTNKNFRQH